MRFLLVSLNGYSFLQLEKRQSILKRQLDFAGMAYEAIALKIRWDVEVDKTRFTSLMVEEYTQSIGVVGDWQVKSGANEILIDLNRPGGLYPQGGLELAWGLCRCIPNVSVLGCEVDMPLLRELFPSTGVYATAEHFINDQKLASQPKTPPA